MVAVNDLATNKMSSGSDFVIIFRIIPEVFCLTARRMIRASGPFFCEKRRRFSFTVGKKQLDYFLQQD